MSTFALTNIVIYNHLFFQECIKPVKFEKSSLGTCAKIRIGDDGSYVQDSKVI